MEFKTWLSVVENLSGPGGGPQFKSNNPKDIPKDDEKHGVGAFPTYGKDDPPRTGKSPVARFAKRKFMKKRKKTWSEGSIEKINVPFSMGLEEVPTIINPTAQEAKQWLQKFGELKAVSDGKDVWIWDAHKADHKTISDALKLDWMQVVDNKRWTLKNPGQIDLIWNRFE